ncbi:hypothetical protein CPC08DRAFT_340102 [Agrocybe pediades]|nr:hypothetical protein CPC08DRAFT_340102 [Agrocybe pediades]
MDMHDTSTDMALSETEKPQTGGGHLGFGLGQLESAARHRTTSMPLAKPKPNDKDNHIRTGTPGVKFTNIQESIRTNAPHPQGVIAPCHLSSTSTGSMQLDVDVDDSVFGTSAMTNVDGDIGAGAGLEPEGAQRRRRSVSETLGGRGVSAWNGRSHERSVKKKKSTSVLMTGQRRLGSASYRCVVLLLSYSFLICLFLYLFYSSYWFCSCAFILLGFFSFFLSYERHLPCLLFPRLFLRRAVW